MQTIMKYVSLALLVSLLLAPSAQAHGGVFFGGVVIGGPAYYPAPAYYYPPQAYYPPAYYYPPYASPAAYPNYNYAQPAYSDSGNSYCREYTHYVTVNGTRQQVVGNACRQPDGSWHIIN